MGTWRTSTGTLSKGSNQGLWSCETAQDSYALEDLIFHITVVIQYLTEWYQLINNKWRMKEINEEHANRNQLSDYISISIETIVINKPT